MHAFNLQKGLSCTGFDEDDPKPEGGHILNLPPDFFSKASELMSFRYSVNGDEAMLKVVPSDSLAEIDVNAMLSKNDSEIFSVTIPIQGFDLTGNDKGLLDNLDSWAVEVDNSSKHVVTKKYVEDVLNKLKPPPQKKEEAKTGHAIY